MDNIKILMQLKTIERTLVLINSKYADELGLNDDDRLENLQQKRFLENQLQK